MRCGRVRSRPRPRPRFEFTCNTSEWCSILSATRTEVARLEESRATALEELAEARLAIGDEQLAAELLAAAVDEFPLRERLTAQLMRALYRCGRQAEALRAFSKLAQRLDEE